MFNEKWFKLLVWILASFFFFVSACVIVGTLGSGPSEMQVHQWMSGMMQAMERSLMAYSMGMEKETRLVALIVDGTQLALPLVLGGMVLGIYFRSQTKNDVKKDKWT